MRKSTFVSRPLTLGSKRLSFLPQYVLVRLVSYMLAGLHVPITQWNTQRIMAAQLEMVIGAVKARKQPKPYPTLRYRLARLPYVLVSPAPLALHGGASTITVQKANKTRPVSGKLHYMCGTKGQRASTNRLALGPYVGRSTLLSWGLAAICSPWPGKLARRHTGLDEWRPG